METESTAAESTAAEAPADKPAEKAADKPAAEKAPERPARPAPMSAQIDELFATVKRLEAFAADEAKKVSNKLIPEVETRAKQNIWVTVLIALGLGLILGIWLTGGRRRD